MKSLTLIFFVSFCFSIIGQNYGNNWCFGDGIRLNFTSCQPTVSTSGNLGTEGCSTYSNNEGELLFYTNSEYVWDSTHNVMPNGALGGPVGTLSQVVIIPKPLSTNQYYIFTTQRQDLPTNRKFQYHEVDMQLNGGLGDITNKNIELHSTPTNEQVAATMHSNGTDIWVMTHEYGTNNFLAFLVTSSGISLSPIVSSVGSSQLPCSANVNSRGNMKFSPDGTKIAFNGNGENGNAPSNILEYFDFDNTTGLVSNPTKLPFLQDEYGLSFSPDNSKLYCATWSTGSVTQADSNYLYQFDISSGDSAIIANSRTILHSGYCLDNQFGTIKIGPDGKVYVAKHDQQYLGVINNPNSSGQASNYIDNGLYLNGMVSNFGLNNYIEYTSYCGTTGLFETSLINTTVVLYPNPAIDILKLPGVSEPYELTIMNSAGKILCSEFPVLNYNTIDITKFENGILFIEIKTKEKIAHFKILKNNN
jgi:hypothetical protein